MILIIDNYDSFTYNIYLYVGQVNSDLKVVKNDQVTISDLKPRDLSVYLAFCK